MLSIAIGSLLGGIFGWVLYETKYWGGILVNPILDMFRSVPLIVQLVLFYNFAPIVGLNLDAFESGLVVLTMYTSALVANVARGGIGVSGQVVRIASVPRNVILARHALRGVSNWYPCDFPFVGWGRTGRYEGQRTCFGLGIC